MQYFINLALYRNMPSLFAGYDLEW